MFDPYHKWLGILPGRRPPTHYQLLGISPEEKDLEVIEEAFIRQTTHLRAYQTGPHSAECTKLLNEVAQAHVTLSDSNKRREYDDELEQEKAYQARAKIRPYNAPLASEERAAAPIPLAPSPKAPKPKRRLHREPRAKGQSPVVYVVVSVGVTALLVLGLVIFLGGSGGKATTEERADAVKEKPSPRVAKENRPTQPAPSTERPSPPADSKPPTPPAGTESKPAETPASPAVKPEETPPAKVEEKDPADLAKVDLLKLVNPLKPEHVVKGRWQFVGKSLVSPLDDFARIQIPYTPPQEYELRIVAERKQGPDATMAVGLVLPGARNFVIFDAGASLGYFSGLQVVDGQSLRNRTECKFQGPVMTKGKPITIVCKVRKQSLIVTANSRELFQFQGDYQRLAGGGKDWEGLNNQALILGTWQASYQFTALELTPITGRGRVLE